MSFLDWWIPAGALDAGETARWSALANHSVGWRAVGGKLTATDRRLIFQPNRVDAGTGGKVWSVPLAQIERVGKRGPTGGLFNGGLRSRLRVVTRDGAEHLFVVNGLARVIETLAGLLVDVRH